MSLERKANGEDQRALRKLLKRAGSARQLHVWVDQVTLTGISPKRGRKRGVQVYGEIDGYTLRLAAFFYQQKGVPWSEAVKQAVKLVQPPGISESQIIRRLTDKGRDVRREIDTASASFTTAWYEIVKDGLPPLSADD